MHSQFHSKKVILLAILIAGFALALAAFVVNQPGAAAPMLAPPDPSSESPSAPDAYRACTIEHVSVFDNRWHIKCTTALPANVYYFAIENDLEHKLMGDRMLVLANTALALNKPVGIYYSTLSIQNPFACLATDCRRLVGVLLAP